MVFSLEPDQQTPIIQNHLIPALARYAASLMPEQEFPHRVSGAALVKACLFEASGRRART